MLCKYFGYYIYTCIMPIGSNKGWRRPIIRMVFSKLITFSIITYSVASCKTNYTRRSIIYNINRCVRLHWSYYSLDSWAKNQTGNALVRLYSLSCCSPFFFFIQHFPVFFDFCFLNLFSAVTTFGDGFFLFFCEGNWPLFTRTLLYIRSYHGVLLHLGSVRRTQLSNIDLLDLFFSSLFVPLVLTSGIVWLGKRVTKKEWKEILVRKNKIVAYVDLKRWSGQQRAVQSLN